MTRGHKSRNERLQEKLVHFLMGQEAWRRSGGKNLKAFHRAWTDVGVVKSHFHTFQRHFTELETDVGLVKSHLHTFSALETDMGLVIEAIHGTNSQY